MAEYAGNIIVLGDLNINLLDPSLPDSRFLIKKMEVLELTQLVNVPTRVTKTSSTLIDHILVIKETISSKCDVIDMSSIFDGRGVRVSDHKLTYCDIILKGKREKKFIKYVCYRDFSNFKIEEMIECAANVQWNVVKGMNSVNEILNFINSAIKDIFDKNAPFVRKRVTKKKAPWRNEAIIALTKEKNYWKKKLSASSSSDHFKIMYCKARNAVNSAIRKAKLNYFRKELAECTNSKEFWAKVKISGATENKEYELPSFLQKPDIINTHFSMMGGGCQVQPECLDFYLNNVCKKVKSSFCFRLVTEREVKAAINKITSGAVGTDGITIAMIKMVGPFCIEAITHLLNVSLTTGVFPADWKEAIIIPLPKVKTPSSVADLRPISVLPALSKVLETIVVTQLVEFLESESILPATQSGFRKGYSTSTALLLVCDDLIKARADRKCTTLAMLDFSQAFDSIDHRLLLAMMSYYRFNHQAVSWFLSYLDGRSHRTKVGSDLSAPARKTLGVPQGSCLGPVLFTLFAATMGKDLQHCQLYSYADDAQLALQYDTTQVSQAVSNLNSDLEAINAWSINHGIRLNKDKCSLLTFPASKVLVSHPLPGIYLGGVLLQECSSPKLLGLQFDARLSFSRHVSIACQRAVARLRMLYRQRHLFPQPTRLRLVQALVLSVFEYCLPVYGNIVSLGDMGRMQRVQNMCVRFICGLRKFDHISLERKSLGLLPMADLCTLRSACLARKILTDGRPEYLRVKLRTRSEMRSRHTRQDDMLEMPRVRCESARGGFLIMPRSY